MTMWIFWGALTKKSPFRCLGLHFSRGACLYGVFSLFVPPVRSHWEMLVTSQNPVSLESLKTFTSICKQSLGRHSHGERVFRVIVAISIFGTPPEKSLKVKLEYGTNDECRSASPFA